MKTIVPLMVWYNGQQIEATILNANVQYDNLQNTAPFQYQLLAETGSPSPSPIVGLTAVVTAILTMTGEAYVNWDNNDYAYDWIAQQLNLTITGNYVPPTPVVPTLSNEEPIVEDTTTEQPTTEA